MAEFELGIDAQAELPTAGQGIVVLFSHKYSIVPLPPEGEVTFVKVAGLVPLVMV